ncbi:MAG: acyltransferase [Candidatus Planktophila sp.]|nr:acyltransferase [Candidatus Planktophila sp.]
MATKRGIQYIPAIDGLRAIAVMAVIFYHLGFTWIPGGFLGVDLFFVISGYVITRLLLDSIERSGGLDLRAFYLARLRRLLPALVFMLITTAIAVGIWAPDTIKRFLIDTPFALTGSMNWWLVGRHLDYFEAIGRPSLLQHTWSLAVEAQFYLIWPLILLAILKFFGKKRISIAALAIAAISGITLMLVSFSLDASNAASVSHVYFGTDTHSIGLFLGAALAVSWIPQNFKTEVSKKAQDFIDGIGVVGFLGILATFLLINESNPALYKIAFPLAGLFAAAIITSIVHPASRFAPILQNRVLLWIGERSYAIYLWHWVIFQVTRPEVDLAGASWAMYSLRILIVFALADISLRFVELPVRRGVLNYWLKGLKYRTPAEKKRQKIKVIATISTLAITLTIISGRAIAISDRQQAALVEEIESANSATAANGEGIWLTGDSVILGIKSVLAEQFSVGLVNARVGRQAPELLDEILRDIANAPSGPVVLNMGNNNVLSEEQVVDIFEALKEQSRVIVVNTAVPRPWRDGNNGLISQVSGRYSNVRVVDWAEVSEGHPEYFAPDGVHLVGAGVAIYVAEIAKYLD